LSQHAVASSAILSVAISAKSGDNCGATLPSLEDLKTGLVEQFRPTVEDLTIKDVGMTD
jgi:hypothetical protein